MSGCRLPQATGHSNGTNLVLQCKTRRVLRHKAVGKTPPARARRRQSLQSCLASLEPDHVQMWIVSVKRTPSSRVFFAPGIVEASIVSDWLQRTNKAVRGAVQPDAKAESTDQTDAGRDSGPGNNNKRSLASYGQPNVGTTPDFGPQAWSLTGALADVTVASPDHLLVTTCAPGSPTTGHGSEDAAIDIIPASPAAKVETCGGVVDSTASSPSVGCHEPQLEVNERLQDHSTGCGVDRSRGGLWCSSACEPRETRYFSPDGRKGRPGGIDSPPPVCQGLHPQAGSLANLVLRAAGVKHRDRDEDGGPSEGKLDPHQCRRMGGSNGFPVSSCEQCISVAPGLLPYLHCLPTLNGTESSQHMIESPESGHDPHSSTLSVLDIEDERSWSRLRESGAASDRSGSVVGFEPEGHSHQAKSASSSQFQGTTPKDNQSRWAQWSSLFDWSSHAHSAQVAPGTGSSETAAARYRLQAQAHSVHPLGTDSHRVSGQCESELQSPLGPMGSSQACKLSPRQASAQWAGVGGVGKTKKDSAVPTCQRDPKQSHPETGSTKVPPNASQAPLETENQRPATAAFTALSPAEVMLPVGESLIGAEASRAPRAALKAALRHSNKETASQDGSSSSIDGRVNHGEETCAD